MKTLKLTDEQSNFLELYYDLIEGDGKEVPAANFAIKWENIETFYSIDNLPDLAELINWLENIKDKMKEFNKNETNKTQTP